MFRLLFILLFFSSLEGTSQTEISWKDLEDVTFTDEYSEEEDAYFYFPKFGSSVKKLNGKEVHISGFMLTIKPRKGIYILSRDPMASCFFCGNGGPESVIELKLKPGHPKFQMDQIVTIRGKLILKNEDFY
jgi:hypothetical protein